MSTETTYRVAVWIMRYGSPDYELCETEEAAASFAAYAMDDGQCAVLGAQFPDGHAVRREDWDAYAAAWTRKIEAETRADDARQPLQLELAELSSGRTFSGRSAQVFEGARLCAAGNFEEEYSHEHSADHSSGSFVGRRRLWL